VGVFRGVPALGRDLFVREAADEPFSRLVTPRFKEPDVEVRVRPWERALWTNDCWCVSVALTRGAFASGRQRGAIR